MVKESLLKFDGRPPFPERIAYTVPCKLSDAEAHRRPRPRPRGAGLGPRRPRPRGYGTCRGTAPPAALHRVARRQIDEETRSAAAEPPTAGAIPGALPVVALAEPHPPQPVLAVCHQRNPWGRAPTPLPWSGDAGPGSRRKGRETDRRRGHFTLRRARWSERDGDAGDRGDDSRRRFRVARQDGYGEQPTAETRELWSRG